MTNSNDDISQARLLESDLIELSKRPGHSVAISLVIHPELSQLVASHCELSVLYPTGLQRRFTALSYECAREFMNRKSRGFISHGMPLVLVEKMQANLLFQAVMAWLDQEEVDARGGINFEAFSLYGSPRKLGVAKPDDL